MVRMVSFRHGRGCRGFGRFAPLGVRTERRGPQGHGPCLCETLVLAVVLSAATPLDKRQVTAEVCRQGGHWSSSTITLQLRELAKRGLLSKQRPPGGYALNLYGPPAPTT
jgi:hypothetical protein